MPRGIQDEIMRGRARIMRIFANLGCYSEWCLAHGVAMRGGEGMDEMVGKQVADQTVVFANQTFNLDDLHLVRDLVRSAAAHAGVTTDDLDRLLVAVTEMAGNAIRYAGGGGTISVHRDAKCLIVTISDTGPGLPVTVTMDRPDPGALGGRGLWLARVMCPDLTIASSPAGVTVTLTVPCAAA